jgi:hypothetical protein
MVAPGRRIFGNPPPEQRLTAPEFKNDAVVVTKRGNLSLVEEAANRATLGGKGGCRGAIIGMRGGRVVPMPAPMTGAPAHVRRMVAARHKVQPLSGQR